MAMSKAYQNWDDVFQNPNNITIESLNTGYIAGSKEGIINVHAEAYQDQCSFKNVKMPVLAHLVSRDNKHYLVDTGFDSSFSKRWGGSFKGIFRSLYFRNRYYQPDSSLGIEKQLIAKRITPDTIFLTHAHEHSAGLDMFDDAIPLVMGKEEHDVNFFPLVYATQIKSRKNVRYLDFCADGIDMPPLGRCIDLFQDGSFWAIDTHGHTKGHVSYLLNGLDRIVLLTGDTSITSMGFSIGVESGSYSENAGDTKACFDKLKEFAEAYPQAEIVHGHEVTGRYDIDYT